MMEVAAMGTQEFPTLKFRGKEFVFVKEYGTDKTGVLTTLGLFLNYGPSFAHLLKDGSIKRFGRLIGTVDDIEWISEIPLEVL
jgi:hypothetical protein